MDKINKKKEMYYYNIYDVSDNYRISNIRRVINLKTGTYLKSGNGKVRIKDKFGEYKNFSISNLFEWRLKKYKYDIDGDVYFNFGMHNNEKIIDVAENDMSYINWLLEKTKNKLDIEILSKFVKKINENMKEDEEEIYVCITPITKNNITINKNEEVVIVNKTSRLITVSDVKFMKGLSLSKTIFDKYFREKIC